LPIYLLIILPLDYFYFYCIGNDLRQFFHYVESRNQQNHTAGVT